MPKDKNGTQNTEETTVEETEVEENGATDTPDPEDTEAGLDEAGVEGADEGGEDSEAGEDTGEDEGGEEVVEEDETESEAAKRIEALEKELQELKNKPTDQPKFREPTEEEKAALMERTGLEWKSHEHINNSLAELGIAVKNYVDQKFAELSFDRTFSGLASQRGFEDATKYKAGIDEYLKDVSPMQRTNIEVLKKAYYFAKGKGLRGAVEKVIKSREKNRRMATMTKPTPGSGGKPSSKGKVSLTPIQMSAARAVGMAPEEYAKYLNRNKKVGK